MAAWTEQRSRIKPKAKERIKKAGKEDRISDETCCALACVSYSSEVNYLEKQLPVGWKFLESCNTASGYDAAALHHTETQTLVILNRGTEWSEKEDLLQHATGAVSGEDYGQIEDALSFMGEMWKKHSAKSVEIKVVGHSLGGALAEAQVCLGAAAMTARNIEPPRDIFGIGIASAGYWGAIQDLAQRRKYAINTDTSDITHYVRGRDVIQELFLTDRFGSVSWRGSIFQASWEKKNGPHGGRHWEPIAHSIHNHDCCTYFEHFDVGVDRHIVWRWRAELYERRDGERAPPYPNFQVPKSEI
jgi:hypothetical protein